MCTVEKVEIDPAQKRVGRLVSRLVKCGKVFDPSDPLHVNLHVHG